MLTLCQVNVTDRYFPSMNSLEQEISELEQRLYALDAERATVAQALAILRQQRQEQIDSFTQRVGLGNSTASIKPTTFFDRISR